jgi:carbonic anhydrase/acetyltransferase-like protein (isoleucine patch superfamily)
LSLSRNIARAAVGAVEDVMSRMALRGATRVGVGIRIFGWPRIENAGELSIGNEVAFVSSPSAVEVIVGPGGQLVIGDKTLIESGASIRAAGTVRIGQGVRIGAGCIVYGEGSESKETSIGDGAWLENGAIVLGGTRVAPGTVVPGRAMSSVAREVRISVPVDSTRASMADAERRIRKVLSRIVPATSDVESSTELTQVAGWDSLAALRALVALEKEFAVMLPIHLFAERPSVASVTPIVAASTGKPASVA